MGIISTLGAERILPELQATSKKEVLRELAGAAAHLHPELSAEELLKVLEEREALGSTGVGDGVAIPHGKLTGISSLSVLFGRSLKGIGFDAMDGRPTHLFFLLLAPVHAAAPYLAELAEISRFAKDPEHRNRLMLATSLEEILAVFKEAG